MLFKDSLLKMELNVFLIDGSRAKILTSSTKPPKMKSGLQNPKYYHCRHYRCSLCCPRNICCFLLGKNMLFITCLLSTRRQWWFSIPFLTLTWQVSWPHLVHTSSCTVVRSRIVRAVADHHWYVWFISASSHSRILGRLFSTFKQKIHSLLQQGKSQILSGCFWKLKENRLPIKRSSN